MYQVVALIYRLVEPSGTGSECTTTLQRVGMALHASALWLPLGGVVGSEINQRPRYIHLVTVVSPRTEILDVGSLDPTVQEGEAVIHIFLLLSALFVSLFMGVEVTKLQAEDDQQDAKLMARVWTGDADDNSIFAEILMPAKLGSSLAGC